MNQNGPYKGSGSDVYGAASIYFAKREKMGIKLPTASKKRKTSTEGEESTPTSGAKKSTGSKKAAVVEEYDVSVIYLDSEMHDAVPVYDTCGVVRRKINDFVKKDGMTLTGFCNILSAQPHGVRGDKVSTNSLSTFRSQSGVNRGNTSLVFYTGYVFFEKLRIKQGKAKTAQREEMEKAWGAQGFDVKHDHSRGFWMMKGESASMDMLGKLTIAGPNGVRKC